MMILLGTLPVVAFALWLVVMWRLRFFGNVAPLRQALLTVAPLWAAWLVLGTELLSLFNAINRPCLILWWLVPLGAAAVVLLRPHPPLPTPGARDRWKPLDCFLAALLLFLVAACGIPALLAPPMNFDSLTYHLPRIVMWSQHHNVAHFSTNNLRQMMMSPYAEFVGLHFMVLTGSDAFIPLIQWCAFVFALVAISLIARQLGAGRSGQLLAAIIASSIPGLFLEASNTKNDVVEAMWTVLAAYWALTFLDRAKGILPRMALLGFCIGAAVLTKGTGAFFTGPAAFVAAVALFRHERLKAVGPLVVMTLFALALNAGHFTRNYRQFGKIAGPETKAEGGYVLLNARKTPPAVASNILRELAIESGTPWPAVNAHLNDAINRLHQFLGIDPHDPGLTFSGSAYTGVAYNPHDEDRAGSPAHVLLALLTFPLACFLLRGAQRRRVLLLYGIGTATFVIFCALLRWQEWNTRLLLPSGCLIAPAIAALWTTRRLLYLSPLIAGGLLLALVPTLQVNDRPLWGPGNVWTTPRFPMRFHMMPFDIPSFQHQIGLITSRHPRHIAFATGGNAPDYLMMRLILDNVKPPPLLEYINPLIPAKGSVPFSPDIIIGSPDSTVMTDPTTRRTFVAVQQNRWFSILVPGTPDAMYKLPFSGFDAASGLNPVEGPYPQWDLPQVRWGIYPDTRLTLSSQIAAPAELYVEARRNDSLTQSLTVLLNGVPVATHAFQPTLQFEKMQVPLSLRAGQNTLTLHYANGDPPDAYPPGRAVLFRVLQVRPAPATQPSP